MGRCSMSIKDAAQTSPRDDARPPPGSLPSSASRASRSAAMCHSYRRAFVLIHPVPADGGVPPPDARSPLRQGACQDIGGPVSMAIGFDYGFGKGLRGFLRQVVPDAALDKPVLVPAREFLRVGTRVRVRCAIRITFEGNGGHRDHREFGKPPFQLGVFRLAFGQTEPPSIVMDD